MLLSCDTLIVCVYEATCSDVERLVVSVDVEKDGGQETSLWQAVLPFSLFNVLGQVQQLTGA